MIATKKDAILATDYTAQFRADIDACRTAIDALDTSTAMKHMAKAKASHAALLNLKASDQGSSFERQQALDGLLDAIKTLREFAAEDNGGAAMVFPNRPDTYGGDGAGMNFPY